ncbi:MAG: AI-2E family transporter [Candidatus Nanopelagicales bacterium]
MTDAQPPGNSSPPPDAKSTPETVSTPNPVTIPATLSTWAGITWRVLVVLAGFVAIFYVMGLVSTVLIALFLGAFFTALASPIRNVFAKVMPRPLALITSIITIAVAIAVVLFVVVSSIINQGPALAKSVNSAFSEIQTWTQGPPLNLTNDDFTKYVADIEKWIVSALESFAVGTVSSIGELVIGGSVLIFAVIFFMSSPQRIWNFVVSWMPTRAQKHVDVSGQLAWDSLSGYTRGVVVVALADSLLVFIGLVILQVPLAPALAAIVFFGAFIPVIGAPIATFFAAIIALAERGPLIALLVVVLTVIVGSFDGDVLQPLVMGKAVSLHPLAIILLIAIGSITLGIIGALVAVPIGAAIYRVAKYLTNRDPEYPFLMTKPAG